MWLRSARQKGVSTRFMAIMMRLAGATRQMFLGAIDRPYRMLANQTEPTYLGRGAFSLEHLT